MHIFESVGAFYWVLLEFGILGISCSSKCQDRFASICLKKQNIIVLIMHTFISFCQMSLQRYTAFADFRISVIITGICHWILPFVPVRSVTYILRTQILSNIYSINMVGVTQYVFKCPYVLVILAM